MFFQLAPRAARLSDINDELINAFLQVRDRLPAIIAALSKLRVSRSIFEDLRRHAPEDLVGRAVRFLYLNKTAFNGLYRVNRDGGFNVPFAGKQGRAIYNESDLKTAALLLQGCDIIKCDFAETIALAGKGDLVYCDPPYTVQHNNNGFIRYNERLFSWKDQQRLAELARSAVKRGSLVLVSNADHPCLRRLYSGFSVMKLKRTSCMAGRSDKRGATWECLFIGKPRI